MRLLVFCVVFILLATSVFAVSFDFYVGEDVSRVLKHWTVNYPGFSQCPQLGTGYQDQCFRIFLGLNFPDGAFFFSVGPASSYNAAKHHCFGRVGDVTLSSSSVPVFSWSWPSSGGWGSFGWIVTNEVVPVNKFVDSLSIRDVQGFNDGATRRSLCDHRHELDVHYLLVNGSSHASVAPWEGSKDLGLRITDVMDVPSVYDENISVGSDNPKVLVYFNDNPGERLTKDYNSEIFACADLDENGECDFVQEATFCPADTDFYAGLCCGTGSHWTCAYDSSLGSYCGKDSSGWRWAGLEDVGLISDLSVCPGGQWVSNGTSLFVCGASVPGLGSTWEETDECDTTAGSCAFSMTPQCAAGTSSGSSCPSAGGECTVFNFTTSVATRFRCEAGPVVDVADGDAVVAGGHDYVCDSSVFIECGGDDPYSPQAKVTGESYVWKGKTYFCTDDGKWRFSLDNTSKRSCELSGFNWTGSKCCGEPDDPLTTYEESPPDDALGGCFGGEFVPSGSFVRGDDRAVNFKGVFFLCDSSLSVGEINLTSLTGTPQPFPLVADILNVRGPCGFPFLNSTGLPGSNLVCSPYDAWRFTPNEGETFVKNTSWSSPFQLGCCEASQCWDGSSCRDVGEYYRVGGGGFRCE